MSKIWHSKNFLLSSFRLLSSIRKRRRKSTLIIGEKAIKRRWRPEDWWSDEWKWRRMEVGKGTSKWATHIKYPKLLNSSREIDMIPMIMEIHGYWFGCDDIFAKKSLKIGNWKFRKENRSNFLIAHVFANSLINREVNEFILNIIFLLTYFMLRLVKNAFIILDTYGSSRDLHF
jgi:hypothetical protein